MDDLWITYNSTPDPPLHTRDMICFLSIILLVLKTYITLFHHSKQSNALLEETSSGIKWTMEDVIIY